MLQMSGQSQPQPPAAWKAAKPFVNGGLSGMMATCIIQPIDMVKVRIQLGAKGSPVSHDVHTLFICGCSLLEARTATAHNNGNGSSCGWLSVSPGWPHYCIFVACEHDTNPIVYSRYVLQLAVGADIVRKEGVGALYKGLSAGLLRQATYTTTRLGVFNVISEDLKARNQGKVSLSLVLR